MNSQICLKHTTSYNSTHKIFKDFLIQLIQLITVDEIGQGRVWSGHDAKSIEM